MITCLVFLLPLGVGPPYRKPADLVLLTTASQTATGVQTTCRSWFSGSSVAPKMLQLSPRCWLVGCTVTGEAPHCTAEAQGDCPGKLSVRPGYWQTPGLCCHHTFPPQVKSRSFLPRSLNSQPQKATSGIYSHLSQSLASRKVAGLVHVSIVREGYHASFPR